MVTPLQEAIFEELKKYTSIEIMRENAQAIADKVAQNPEIQTCSKTYVLRMIKRREDSSETVSFKVEPPEPEAESEVEEESEELSPKDAEDWEFEDKEEPEPESEPEKGKSKDFTTTPIEEIIDAQATKTLVVVPFRLAADWTGYDGFLLTEEETKQLIPVVRPLLIKYVPDILGKYLPEILCAFVVLMVLGPKIKGYREFEEKRRKATIAQEKAEKSAEEREKRKLEFEEQERLRRVNETQPQPEEPKKPKTKDEAGMPSWNDPKRVIG